MRALSVAVALACSFSMTAAVAQQKPAAGPGGYPSKPVRVLVGSPAGSGSDVITRAVAQKLSEIPKELTPVTLMISQPYLLVATPSLPAASVKEVIALAKAKPLVYASSGAGTVVHLGMELFKSMAGVEMTHIPYKGSGLSMIDLMSGCVQLAITNTLTATPLARGGKIKAIAITSPQRVQAMPDLPTIAESGLPGYELRSWYGMLVPNGTPAPRVQFLNREVGVVMGAPEVKERLVADGAEAATANTPVQFRDLINVEVARWGRSSRTWG